MAGLHGVYSKGLQAVRGDPEGSQEGIMGL